MTRSGLGCAVGCARERHDSFAVDMLACSGKSMILLFTPVHTKLSSISFTIPNFLGS